MIFESKLQKYMQTDEEKTQKEIFKDVKTQESLNKPVADPTGINVEDQKFLEKLLKMINTGKINLYVPSSIINYAVYDNLDGEKQGAIEVKAVTILATIREIKGLHDAGYGTSFQIQNLVSRLRENVATIEEAGGDVFLI